ncbi:S-layer homology domain-containing protein [Paenibacillus sp. YN15]|uniref:S-layer homology domain-containing protein n=1 Tax=Paenibacillus sp. YN15 TaxID=1742774 RepID=UPI0015EC60F5|nr:S-layer homology domain-containing protein [Paenibacillus sp. YN15]
MMKRMLSLLLAILLLGSFIPQLAFTPTARADTGPQPEEKLHYYIPPNYFYSFGSWTLTGSYVTGRATASTAEEADPGDGGEPAIARVNVESAGQYKLWVRDRDFATNQPGTRTFHVGVDGARADKKFGAHGQEGFRWTEVGVYTLEAGVHELSLIDTSAFYARCEGFFLTKDLSLVPPEDLDELIELAQPEDPFSALPPADFPEWAAADVPSAETASIENGSVKVVFHKGTGQEGDLVQNEIFIKEDGQWLQVKEKTEQLGFLMMAASNSQFAGQDGQFIQFSQEVELEGVSVNTVVSDFFRSGVPVWFIPSGFTKINDHKVELSFPSHSEAELKVVFELDDLSDDPKVTLEAEFSQEGAYSFLLFSGNETAYSDFDTVTAPLLYVKKNVPAGSTIVPESYLFTPMATLHYAEGNTRFGGKAMTSGIAMDPVSVPQDYAYPETSSFGLVLRGPEQNVRPQFTAPMFGSGHSLFEAGDSYSVSYRIINQAASWYDTFKHTAENLYNARDIRTNYFHSLNEAIYNATDLMMDDDYGGWDTEDMAHYNMEEKDLVTVSNSMAALQRYLLTEDEAILDDRAIPTLAYILGRNRPHFRGTGDGGTSNYAGALPTPIGGPITNYSAHVYGGLYEMTQGRMPFLLDQAVQSPSQQASLAGVADQAIMFKYTEDEQYLNHLRTLADRYLQQHPNAGANREIRFVNGFVYGDYIPMVATLLAAYEATGEQRYLDGAEQNAQLLLTGVWTTGYHDDYAETDYTVTQEKSGTRPLYANRFNFWWHGEQQWRLGNVDGEAKPAQELGVPLETETAPGWLGGRVGMGTEHPSTPGHGNVITMNNWAGMLAKLSVYTGDEFFYNMARNATIGRYGNYPGYYQDRILFHQMKEDYPYTGPDFTSIYWHHIPVFISMLEDFLINSAWVKSEQHVEFPSLYQSGYAYFASNQFGHAPGKFYEEEDMWLWLDRGIVEPDTVEIDYVAARKDGVLGVALMNEGNDAVTSTVTLGEKADPAGSYTGTATVYEADGSKSAVSVVNGAFTLTIPAKGIKSVVLHGLTAVKTPAYANPDFEYSNYTEGTTVEHTRGKGHVIQVTPESYYAYVYATDQNDTTDKAVLNYTIGGESFSAEKTGYPYEFLIKVDDPSKSFQYELTVFKTDGGTEVLGGGELKPYDFSHSGIELETSQGNTVSMDTWALSSGADSQNNTLRLEVPAEDFFPLLPAANVLKGMKVSGVLTHRTDGSTRLLSSEIVGNEVNHAAGTLTLIVKPTAAVPLASYDSYNIFLSVQVPAERVLEYEELEVAVTLAGMNSSRKEIRLVVSQSDFPYPLEENKLKGLRIKGTLTHKQDQSVLQLDSVIRGNEVRAGGTTVLVVEPTLDVPLKDYKDYNFAVKVVSPAYWRVDSLLEPVDVAVTLAGMNSAKKEIRLVVSQSDFPEPLEVNSLQGLKIKGTLTHKTNQSVLQLDSVIRGNEIRTNGTTVLVVEPTTAVPLADYKDYNFDIAVYFPVSEQGSYEAPFDLTVTQAGMNPGQRVLRLVVPQSEFPVPLEELLPNGLRITGEFKNIHDGTVLGLDSFVLSTEIRSSGTAVLVVPPTSRVLLKEYKNADYTMSLTIHPQLEGIWNLDDRREGHFLYKVNEDGNGVTVTGFTGRGEAVIPPVIAGLPVVAIGDSAFQGKGLTQAVIPDSVRSIGHSAFRDNALTGIVLPEQVETVEDSALRLNALTEVAVGGTDAVLGRRLLDFNPAGLTILGYEGSTAQAYAAANGYKFQAILPVEIGFQPDGREAWGKTASTVVSVTYGRPEVLAVWSPGPETPGKEAGWQPVDAAQPVKLEAGDGLWYLHVRAEDGAGHPVFARSQAFRLDNTAPDLEAVGTQEDGTAYAPGGWTSRTVSWAVYARDEGSGLDRIDVSLDGGENWREYAPGEELGLTDSGVHTLLFRAADQAGNLAEEAYVTRISKEGLQVAAGFSKDDGTVYVSGTWSNRPVTASVYAVNVNGPTVTSVTYSLDQGQVWLPYEGPIVIGQEGIHKLWFQAEDEAGNRMLEKSEVRLDLTAPEVEFAPDGREEALEGAAAVITVRDEGSGADGGSLEYVWSRSLDTPGEEAGWSAFANGEAVRLESGYGEWVLHVRAADRAGNRVLAQSRVFRLDAADWHNAYLSSLSLAPVNLAGFDRTVTDYTLHADHQVDSITVKAVPKVPEAAMKLKHNGGEAVELASGQTTAGLPLAVGTNRLELRVTAADGAAEKLYTVNVIRASAPYVPPEDGDEESSEPAPEQPKPNEPTALAPGQPEPGKPGAGEPETGEPDTGGPGAEEEPPFTDAADHWSKELFRELKEKGIIDGYPDGSIQPERGMTRGEFAAVLIRALGEESAGARLPEEAFADAEAHWAKEAIYQAYVLGWINGLDGGRFGPDEGVTREQLVVILMRAILSIQGKTVEESGQAALLAFNDEGKISSWALGWVKLAVKEGLVDGYPDGSFRPAETATRAEAAALLARALQSLTGR